MTEIDKSRGIAVIGGDLRFLEAALCFRKADRRVNLYGFSPPDGKNGHPAVDPACCSSCLSDADDIRTFLHRVAPGYREPDDPTEVLEGCNTVLLPLPATYDGKTVALPMSDHSWSAQALMESMHERGMDCLCGGKLPTDWKSTAQSYGIETFDYYAVEEFAVSNAVPTAEGAIEIAMHQLPVTLDGSELLVIGYGRIGKILARKLQALGAQVTVSARRQSDFAWIRANGMRTAETGKLSELFAKGYHPCALFNTVPARVLDRDALSLLDRETRIIDLASGQSGVDITAAAELGLSVIWALSLPGKCAPVTAGRIIADTVLHYLDCREGTVC